MYDQRARNLDPNLDAEQEPVGARPWAGRRARPSTARAAIPALVLSAALLLPQLGKAFTIDDTLFLLEAQHALQDPWHPTAFQVVWNERVERLSHVFPSGPVQAWLLTPCIRAGGREWVAHATMLGALWLAILATVSLARRMGLGAGGMATAGLLVVASPVVLALAGTAMPDVTVMMLATAALERLVAYCEERRLHQAVAASALLALAPLTRTHALLLHAVGAILLLGAAPVPRSWGARVRRLAPLLVALLVTLAVLVGTRDPVPDAGNIASSVAELSSGSWKRLIRNLAGFPVHWVLTTAFVLPWLVLRWRAMVRSRWVVRAAALGAVVGAAAAIRTNNFPWPLIPVAGLGVASLVDAFQEAWRGGRVQEVALAAWLLPGLVALPYVHLPAKYLVASAPAAAILLALAASRTPGRAPRLAIGVTLVLGTSLGLAILRADAAFADLGRRAAAALVAPRVAAGQQVWFVGHWGFQWYAEQAGARPASLDGPAPSPGDLVVASANSDPSEKVLRRVVQAYPDAVVVERMQEGTPGGRIMNHRLKVGFFSNTYGTLPWTWSRAPLDVFTAWQLGPVTGAQLRGASQAQASLSANSRDPTPTPSPSPRSRAAASSPDPTPATASGARP